MRATIGVPTTGGDGSSVQETLIASLDSRLAIPVDNRNPGRAQPWRGCRRETSDSRQALALSPRCHAHVHCCCLAAAGGGNMWKYIAIIIGMKTIVL